MLYIRNDSDEPYFNLALEEYVLKRMKSDNDYIIIWKNKPSLIVGRFQNTVDEINIDFIRKNNLCIARRITGGKAVYNDYGTLNYSLVEKNDPQHASSPVFPLLLTRALQGLGIEAVLGERNDILLDKKIISHNVQYQYNGNTLHHGVVFFDCNLTNMREALASRHDKPTPEKAAEDKYANVLAYLGAKMNVDEFREALADKIFGGEPVREFGLSEKDLAQVNELTAEKYLTWGWNFGTAPLFNIKKFGRFSSGAVELRLSVEKGIINGCRVFGDFFSSGEISDFEAGLIGVRYDKNAVGLRINDMDIRRYFGDLGKEELTGLFF